jgi:PPOX class probable F420-dependent enzyme
MDAATMKLRVATAPVGRLATVDETGQPHIVAFCFALDDSDVLYSAVDAKPKATMALKRLANVRAQPRVSVLVDHYDDDWSQIWWVRMDGTGRVLDDGAERDRALFLLVSKYRQYQDDPPSGPVLGVTISRWRAWSPEPSR